MLGLVMDSPLLISSLIEYAARNHGETEIVSQQVEGGIHRYDYRRCHQRSCQLAHALHRIGIDHGDRVGTLAWNGHRHLELYYAVSGMGAVYHTINPRLFADQLLYIINHAADRVLFVDLTFVPLLESLAVKLDRVRAYVVLCDEAQMPQVQALEAHGAAVYCYESLLHAQPTSFQWPQFDEREASALCYTSGTTGMLKPRFASLSVEQRHAIKLKQGRTVYGVQMKIVNDDGIEQDCDGRSVGQLLVRGPWIASAYFDDAQGSEAAFTDDGWFRTGDVATLDGDGHMQIVDRSKDLITSGGEWISSIDLENAAVGHPDIAEAAAVAVADAKWGERPLLVVVLREGRELGTGQVLAWLENKVARWWLPERVLFVPELPHTATGKISKKELRERVNAMSLV